MRNETTAHRIERLLDWLNDEDYERKEGGWWYQQLPKRLASFIASFDGSEASGYLRAEITGGNLVGDPTTEGEAIDLLWLGLRDILNKGFGPLPGYLPDTRPPKSPSPAQLEELGYLPGYPIELRFAVERRTRVTIATRQRLQLPGEFALRLIGPVYDLVPFLFAHLLLRPGAARLKRCPAPKAKPFEDQLCGAFFVVAADRGQPARYCEQCRKRSTKRVQIHRLSPEARERANQAARLKRAAAKARQRMTADSRKRKER